MSINNQPTIEPRTVTGIFTKYMAKTLPLAFDESMSYYECLCALLEYLNETIVPDINNVNDGLSELQQFYLQLQEYVNDYFNNLDVQEEINNKLDQMAEDGSLSQLIGMYIDPLFNEFTEDMENELASYKSSINNQVSTMNNKIDALSMGAPLAASSTAGMTDTTKVYVNTTDGKWYYYNGTAWTAGGDYQSSGIATNSVEPDMLKYTYLYNLYNVSAIEFNKLGGNYQRLIVPASAGQVYGAFRRMPDGSIIRSYDGNGAGARSTLLYFFSSSMTDPDNTTGRLETNINPHEDVTAPANTAWLVMYLVNTSASEAYMPDDFMLCEMTDKMANTLEYHPYGYYFKHPYIIDYSDGLKDRIEELESDINNNTKLYPHKDKKILGLGDSYTFLNYYGPYLEAETKVDFDPRGYNGASIRYFVSDNYTPTGGGGSISQLPITTELLSQYDAVTVMGGTNNYGQSIQPLGTINDEIGANTVHGDIKYVINHILTRKPDIEVIWCTEPFRLSYGEQPAPGGYAPNSQGYTMQDVANAIIEECKHYGLPCFDFYSNSQWNSYSVRREDNELVENKFTYDGLHPKDGDGNGADLLGSSFGAFINTLRF